MKLIRTILAICVLFTIVAFAQDKPRVSKNDDKAPKPIEVRANVMVLDSRNQYVGALKQEDIKLFEDGVEQKLNYFSEKETEFRLALVVDNSGSLRSRLPDLLTAAGVLVSNLDAGDRAIIIRFVSSEKIEIVQDWTADKPAAIKAIDNMFIEGGQSAVIDAVYLAVEKLKDVQKSAPSKRYAVVLLSDCDDLSSYYNTGQLLDLVARTDIQIFPFALVSDGQAGFLNSNRREKARELAKSLALSSGGNAYIFDGKFTKDIVVDKLKSLVRELRSQYVIGYRSSNLARGLDRKLRVEIVDGPKVEKRQGLIRDSFGVSKK